MAARLSAAAIALALLTAFAPAPFPRRPRSVPPALSLAHLQGTWEVVRVQTTRRDGRHQEVGDPLKEVSVQGARWSFHYRRGGKAMEYTITIDPRAKPPALDFYRGSAGPPAATGKPYGTGILRRAGPQVQLLYSWGQPRARSFEEPPESYWLITLRRAP